MNESKQGWAIETIEMINKLTPDVIGKAWDPGWFLLRQHLERAELAVNSHAALLAALGVILAQATPVQTLPWEKTPVVGLAKTLDAIARQASAAIAQAAGGEIR